MESDARAAVGLDKDGIWSEFARGSARPGCGAGLERRHGPGDRRGRPAGHDGRGGHRVPEMLDHRVVTLHPKIHGGILADLGKESHRADLEAHGIEAFDLVVSNLYPFASDPGIELIDVGGPAMVRAAAKNHAWVGIVTNPAQYGTVLEELRAVRVALGRDTPRRSRSRRSRAPPRTTRRSSSGCPPDDGAAAAPGPRARAHRRDVAVRREPASAGRALPAARHHELVGRRRAAQRTRARATSTTTTPTPRGSRCTISVTVPPSRSSSTPTRAVSRSLTTSRPCTGSRWSATSAPRSAGSWR